jgi:hypothetical protein
MAVNMKNAVFICLIDSGHSFPNCVKGYHLKHQFNTQISAISGKFYVWKETFWELVV